MSDVTTRDAEHLRLLGIFHYVVAGISGLFALFPLIHLAIGVAILSGAIGQPRADEGAIFVGWFFVLFASAWIFFGLLFALLVALAGRYLLRRRHHTYCLVVAGLSCLFLPCGTVLGVFSIIVLMRESVKPLFEAPPG